LAGAFQITRNQLFQRQFEKISEDKQNEDARNQQNKIQQSNISNSLSEKQAAQQRSVLKTAQVKQTKRIQEIKNTDQIRTQKITNAKDLGARANSLALLEDTPVRQEFYTAPPVQSEPLPTYSSPFKLSAEATNQKRSAVKAIQSESLAKADSVRNFSQKIILEARTNNKRNILRNPEKLNHL